MWKSLFIPLFLGLGLPGFAKESFEQFLDSFVPKVATKSSQANRSSWILETTGSSDAADLTAEISTELSLLFNDPATYQKLLKWDKDISLAKNPILKRQLNILIRAFKENSIEKNLLAEIAQKEAKLSYSYANFRAHIKGQSVSENELLTILKKENSPTVRQEAWEASKEIGSFLAPQILDLVSLRNKAAQSLGYENYFTMQLDLQEVDEKALFQMLDHLASQSDAAYTAMLLKVEEAQSKRFSVSQDDLGPWAWSEPFCQEDPLNTESLDSLVKNLDMCKAVVTFYKKMGIDVEPILEKSDMFERPGKNQHAFCTNIDRESDIRTLNNVKPSIKWWETVLHEFGHAIYEMGFAKELPWMLREPPHMITTEAMALMAGRRAYLGDSLRELPTYSKDQEPLIYEAEESLKRRQLIFSRWVLVMTYFERELYRNPEQDLNKLWWSMVQKYQKIAAPKNREDKQDWAAKYHIGLAPVYYYSYLLGEMFASSMEETLFELTGTKNLETEKAGTFLNEKLFAPGDKMSWSALIEHVVNKPLTGEAWLKEFAK